MFPGMGAVAGLGGMGGMTNGAGSPISSSASAETGDQTLSQRFQGGNLSFGGGTNNQLLILGGIAVVGLYLMTRKK